MANLDAQRCPWCGVSLVGETHCPTCQNEVATLSKVLEPDHAARILELFCNCGLQDALPAGVNFPQLGVPMQPGEKILGVVRPSIDGGHIWLLKYTTLNPFREHRSQPSLIVTNARMILFEDWNPGVVFEIPLAAIRRTNMSEEGMLDYMIATVVVLGNTVIVEFGSDAPVALLGSTDVQKMIASNARLFRAVLLSYLKA